MMTTILILSTIVVLAIIGAVFSRWLKEPKAEAQTSTVVPALKPTTAAPSQNNGNGLAVGKSVRIPVKTSSGERLMNGTLVRTNMARAWVKVVHIRPGIDAVVRRRLRFVRVAI